MSAGTPRRSDRNVRGEGCTASGTSAQSLLGARRRPRQCAEAGYISDVTTTSPSPTGKPRFADLSTRDKALVWVAFAIPIIGGGIHVAWVAVTAPGAIPFTSLAILGSAFATIAASVRFSDYFRRDDSQSRWRELGASAFAAGTAVYVLLVAALSAIIAASAS